jgi:Protein of unknown function (DUF1822)
MIDNADDFMDDIFMLDYQIITEDSIELLPEQVAVAARESADTKSETRWQNYLDRLALIGIEEWLKDRVPELRIKHDLHKSISYLTVGNFNLFIITLDSIGEDIVTVSKVAIDKAELRPHLYVLVEVLEEPRLVRVCGCLSQIQLVQQREAEASRIEEEDDATYLLPLDWFELDPAQVLLYLRCLHPSALIPQPTVEVRARTFVPSIVKDINSGIVQVGEGVKQVVRELSLILQPPLQLSSAMRANSEEDNIAMLVSQLQDEGMDIPSKHIYAYSKEDLQWKDVSILLHVIKWKLSNAVSNQRWSLLLILGTSDEKKLPSGLIFTVKDTGQNLLFEHIISKDIQPPYLYSQVEDNLQEQFQVIIQMPDKATFKISSITSPD